MKEQAHTQPIFDTYCGNKYMGDVSKVYVADINNLVKGIMIESYIEDGAQGMNEHIYGKSITDPCLGWEKTEKLILDIADKL